MELNEDQILKLLAQACDDCKGGGKNTQVSVSTNVLGRFAQLLLAPYGDLEKLEAAASVMATPVQMALEMGSVELPGQGVEDLRRGLSLYHDWSNERRSNAAQG